MPLGDLWGLLWETLRTQRLRSFLTVLGIVIGMASVVLLSSIGEGTRKGIAGQFTQFGTTIVSIMPGKSKAFGSPGYVGGTTRRLTLEDALELKRLPGVRYIGPNINGISEVKADGRSRHTYIYGVLAEGQHVWQWGPRIGTFIPDGDPDLIPPVCVLGSKTAKELFPDRNPLGAHVKIAEARFTIVGVMSSKGQMLGFDLDDSVYIPIRRAMKLFNKNQVQEIHLYVGSHSMIGMVEREARRVLIERHGGEEDFTILTNADMLDLIDQVMTVLTTGVLVIAAIAVFVGAMGILTIMWVSVHERTQEIGLIKALGASNRQVMAVFLAEASALSLAGGGLGVALGLGGGWALSALIPGFWVETPPTIIPICLAVAQGVGVTAGILPAMRAARLDPIEALRTE
jgi:putative ABC transport system permease protein